jgi:hypothetical protein
MTESPFGSISYVGKENETATIDVAEEGTVQLMTYNLDGAGAIPVPPDKPITITLKKKADGSPTIVQLVGDFSNPSGGKYIVVVKNVEGYPDNASSRTYKQIGSVLVIKDYLFDVQ